MLNKLSINVKLYGSMLFFAIPVIALNYFIINDIEADLRFSRMETYGNVYERPLVKLLYLIPEYHAQRLSGNAGAELAAAITEEFDIVLENQSRYGADLQFTQAGLASRGRERLLPELVVASWQELHKAGAAAEAGKWQQLVADIRGMIAHAGDISNLILDPDLDSYYVMDVTLLAVPQNLNRLGDLKRNLLMLPQDFSQLSEAQRIELAIQARLLKEADADRIAGSIATAINEDPNFYGATTGFKDNLEAALAAYSSSSQALVAALQSVSAQQGQFSNAQLLKLTEQNAVASAALFEVAVDALDVLLAKRIDSFETRETFQMVISALASLLALILFFLATQSIVVPIRRIEETMRKLADGELKTEIPYTSNGDEIGAMARALNIFKETSIMAESMNDQQEEDRRAKMKRAAAIEQMIAQFGGNSTKALEVVGNAATHMRSSASSLTQVAAHSLEQSKMASSEIEVAKHNIDAVAAAAEELSASIKEISSQILITANVSQEAVDKKTQADATITQLVEYAQKVGGITGIISTIAGQINLLALNATIESARAGEAGRGFAVVASEVKSLANQTAKATDEITGLVQGIEAVTHKVVSALSDIGGTIQKLNEVTTMIASAVEEQQAATQEIARNMMTASGGVDQVCTVMDAAMKDADKTDHAARQVNDTADVFTRETQRLKQDVETFLSGIKSA